MKIQQTFIYFALTALFVFTASCGSGGGISKALQSEESAARDHFLKEEWEKKFKRCGEFYYTCVGCKNGDEYFGNALAAIKTTPSQWIVEQIKLSPADDANNIAWAGNLTVVATMSTYYNRKTKEWMQFWDGTTGFQNLMAVSGPPVFEVVRYKNGKYSVFINNNLFLLNAWNDTENKTALGLAPIENCNEVPPRK
jgi:hypothetical protein